MTSPRYPRMGIKKADWLWIALIGLLVQGLWAIRLKHPTYMDAYYYATNGQRLADGHGFTELILWQFLDQPSGLPAPSHTYWMPLPSLIAAAGYKLSPSFWGAQLPFWVLAGLLPLLSFAINLQLTGHRWQSWTAALLTATGGFYVNYIEQPSTFAPFAWAGGVCLLSIAKTSQKENGVYWWILAGVMAGLGHLTRADGVLLLAICLIIWIADLKQANKRRAASHLFWLLAGYFIIMGSWFARTWMVTGLPLSTVGTQTIFLTTYDDLFAYGRSFDLPHLLNWGWGNILSSKLTGLSVAGQTFIAVSCFIFLAPFVIWGWYRLKRMPEKGSMLRPLTWYVLVLFLVMSLIFTFPGGRGGLFHSSATLWPWFMSLAAIGIGFAVDWAASRFPHWQPERAKRIFAGLFVAVAFIVSLAIGITRPPDDLEGQIYMEIGTQLPEGAVVMAGNAPGFYYYTGIPAVSVPNEPVEVLIQAAEQYKVTHLILDKDRPKPLEAFFEGQFQVDDIHLIDEFNGTKLYVLSNIVK